MKHKSTVLYILILGLFCFVRAGAQESKALTLNEAIELGIKNSKQLKLSQAKIDEAVAATKQATEARLPDASISGSYLRLTKPTIKLKTGSDSSSFSSPTVSQALYGSANVSLPIYAGSKIKYGIESAKYLEQATRLDAEQDKEAVTLNIIAAYINLYKASVSAKVVEENLEQSRLRDSNFASLERNGLLARNDMLRAQLQTSNFELALVDAQNSIQLATVNMNILLGLPESTKLVPDPASITTSGQLQTIEMYEQSADTGRNDMQALTYRNKAAGAAVKVAKGDYYPSIGLTGGYVAANVPKLLTITNAVTFGVGVKYDIGSLWKTKSKVQQAEARAQQLQINKDMMTDNIHLAINQAYQTYLTDIKKIEVNNKAVIQANENYRISKNKYDNNLLLLTDLLDANVEQLQASLNLEVSKADAALDYYTLQQTAGMLK
ncbi:TolC family protein [Parafilimonas sp.]|uniref:TolC family protein n=1 Tax=Parafilimonas sp. TaxID=1969739 RepID=UPI0039E724D9